MDNIAHRLQPVFQVIHDSIQFCQSSKDVNFFPYKNESSMEKDDKPKG